MQMPSTSCTDSKQMCAPNRFSKPGTAQLSVQMPLTISQQPVQLLLALCASGPLPSAQRAQRQEECLQAKLPDAAPVQSREYSAA